MNEQQAFRTEFIPDPRTVIERERAERMEGVRLRLLWAMAAGGDDGICARCAIAVIHFAETEGGNWTDRALRGLHRRLCRANGLPHGRFEQAVRSIKCSLFLPA